MRIAVLLGIAAIACAPRPDESTRDLPATRPAPSCSRSELTHAPPPTRVDGLDTTPIDVLSLEAEIEFDAGNARAQARATLVFQLGEAGGMPFFDLRQSPSRVTLDGEALSPAQIDRHDFGMGLPAGLRVLAVELPACSTHVLELEYPLALPDAAQAEGLRWGRDPARVDFDLSMSDLHPGRYLESWLPTTLPYDQFELTLAIDLVGATTEHALISNGEVEALGDDAWLLDFPASTRPMSPLIALGRSEDWTIVVGSHAAANGQDIAWTLALDPSPNSPPHEWVEVDAVIGEITQALDRFVRSNGPYPHPHLTMVVGPKRRSMEYAGGFTAERSALVHELFHAWWGRGLQPARAADGWIDEAWDMYVTGPKPFAIAPFDFVARPVMLANPHPFSRAMPNAAYMQGRRFFAGVAATIGVDALREAMATLRASRPNGLITSEELQRALVCGSDPREDLNRGFHRFVFGQSDPTPAFECGALP